MFDFLIVKYLSVSICDITHHKTLFLCERGTKLLMSREQLLRYMWILLLLVQMITLKL